MSIAEKLIKIAENEPKVYEAGKTSQIQGITPAEVDSTLFSGKLKTIAENTIRVFEAGRAAASLQKAIASGEAIRVDDVSGIEHNLNVKLTSDTITDFSGVSVSRYGKNLLNLSIAHKYDSYSNKSYYENGTLYVDTGSGNSMGLYTDKIHLPTNTPLCYKHKIAATAADRIIIRCFDKDDNNISANINIGWGSYLAYYEGHFGTGAGGCNFTLPSEVAYIVLVYCRMLNTDIAQNEYKEIQIELGSTATDYESYKEPQTATASADGTVQGLKSLSPTMSLYANTSGVNINLEYYKDK